MAHLAEDGRYGHSLSPTPSSFPLVLRQTCHDLATTLGAHHACLLLYDELAHALTTVACVGQQAEPLRGTVIEGQAARDLLDRVRERPSAGNPSLPPPLAAAFDGSPWVLPLYQNTLIALFLAETDTRPTRTAEQLGRTAANRIQQARPDIGHDCLFRSMVELDPGGIAVVEGEEHVCSYASRSFRRILSSESTPFLGRPAIDLVSSPRGRDLVGLLDEVRRSGHPYHAAVVELRDESGSRYYEVHLIPQFDPSGAVSGIFLMLWPHTEVVLTRQALERTILKLAESQGVLRAVLDSTNNGIFLVAPDQTVLYANRRAGELLGIDATQVVGRPRRETAAVLAARVREPEGFLQRLIHLSKHPEEIATDEVEITQPAHRILERYSAPVHKEDGTLLGRIEVYSDVTEVRMLQRNKDEFLSVVSHELRTPITSIKGYAQLLRRRGEAQPIPPTTLMAYETIERQTRRMQELIDLLLDLTRLDTGRLRLDRHPFDFAALVGRVAEMVRPTATEHEIALEIPTQPILLNGDERRLEQVITNLLANAVQYSPAETGVQVSLSADENEIRLQVRDEGIGIPADQHDRIFERFYRADGVAESSGLGIGLFISRSIVERHGGAIGVESVVGRGSTFTVTFPRGGDNAAGG